MKATTEKPAKLAIVIPAYKANFFREALESIANQTCKDFVLYIGNDNSPHDLDSIVKEFEGQIPMVYQKFKDNLGGRDLVAQWTRCMDMTAGEQWAWLFSDDDIMAENCVESFYNHLEEHPNEDLFHFDIALIDGTGTRIGTPNAFPQHMPVAEFFTKRTTYQINNTVVEYIFRRSAFDKVGGFANYDLAWCADDATWIKIGRNKGIVTIPAGTVYWRYSGENISSNTEDKGVVLRKLKASVEHMNWVGDYFKDHDITDHTSQFQKIKWVISGLMLSSAFSLTEKVKLAFETIKNLNYKSTGLQVPTYIAYMGLKQKLTPTKI